MSDQKNILCFITIGDSERSVEKLLTALMSLPKQNISKPRKDYLIREIPQVPDLVLLPREAFFAKKRQVSLEKAVGEVSGEFIIPFPPDIPIIAPGERITREIVTYTRYLKRHGTKVIGPKDAELENIEVIKQ
jgi:arginine decarboxylase